MHPNPNTEVTATTNEDGTFTATFTTPNLALIESTAVDPLHAWRGLAQHLIQFLNSVQLAAEQATNRRDDINEL